MYRIIIVVFVLMGTILILLGLHNIDLAFNMDYLTHDVGLFGDQTLSRMDLYSSGIHQVILAMFSFIAMFGLMINEILYGDHK